jgi:hypothetical protein
MVFAFTGRCGRFGAFAETSDAAQLVLIVPGLIVLGFAAGFGIIDGRGDDVASADPPAEINDPATVGAEREIRIGGEDDLAAGWATERCLFLRHGTGNTRFQSFKVSRLRAKAKGKFAHSPFVQ